MPSSRNWISDWFELLATLSLLSASASSGALTQEVRSEPFALARYAPSMARVVWFDRPAAMRSTAAGVESSASSLEIGVR